MDNPSHPRTPVAVKLAPFHSDVLLNKSHTLPLSVLAGRQSSKISPNPNLAQKCQNLPIPDVLVPVLSSFRAPVVESVFR